MTCHPILLARSLTMWRGDRRLFADLDISVQCARVLHVRGANGFGKTTLLRILSGLLVPEQGAMTFKGAPFPSADSRASAAIGYLGHLDGLKPDLSAVENLRFAARIGGASTQAAPDAVLDRLGLRKQRDVLARYLSAGQRRRLAIARLVIGEHRLWILDEPFTALDNSGVALLCELMVEALGREVAVVLSSHQELALDPGLVDVLELGDAGAADAPADLAGKPRPREHR